MNTRVARASAAAEDIEVRRDHRGAVTLRHADSGRRVLAELTGDVTHAGGEVLLRDVDVVLHRGERVRIAGANGAGKTTLLTALLRVLATDVPSPGEARELVLARFLSGSASVLVLDEPTNHLDLPSIEHLEAALRTWPGALLLVTHDDHLAAAVTDSCWTVANGYVQVATTVGPTSGAS